MVIIGMLMVSVPRYGRESAEVGSNNHYYVYSMHTLNFCRMRELNDMVKWFEGGWKGFCIVVFTIAFATLGLMTHDLTGVVFRKN